MSQAFLDPCIYCGSSESGTRDHVPPKCLFPRPRPLDTVTVPACRSCNQSFQMDDEYFAVAMGAQGYGENPEAAQVWNSTIRPLLARSPGFRAMLSQQILDGPVRTPAGVVLPNRTAIRFSAPRIDRVVRRIVRGLLWHHYGHVPAPEVDLAVFQQQIVPPEVADTLNTRTTLSWIGGTIFRYRHGLVPDAPDTSIWALQFYAQTQFIVVVQGESFVSARE